MIHDKSYTYRIIQVIEARFATYENKSQIALFETPAIFAMFFLVVHTAGGYYHTVTKLLVRITPRCLERRRGRFKTKIP